MATTTHHRHDAKEFARCNLRGSISAICLPERDGVVDEEGLRRDIRHCIDVIGAGGIYIHGFYGHFWLLDVADRRRVTEIAVDEVGGDVPVICRCWTPALRDTIALVHHAEETGADVISLLGPWLGEGSDDMVYRWFADVASETELGISVFNTAQLGYVMAPELLARVSEIPNVAALKNHVEAGHTRRLRELVGDTITIIDPDEERFLTSLLSDGQRAIYTGTNYMFDSAECRPMHDYIEAALAGDASRATAIYEAMQPLRVLHHQWVIEPWVRTGRCPVSVVKHWSEAMGMTGGAIRPPLDEMTESNRRRLWEGIAHARQATLTAHEEIGRA